MNYSVVEIVKVPYIKENDPVTRVAHTIIWQAIEMGASEIRIDFLPRESVVLYKVADNWHEEMKIPDILSTHLIECFRKMADTENEQRSITIKYSPDGKEIIECQINIIETKTDRGKRISIQFINLQSGGRDGLQ